MKRSNTTNPGLAMALIFFSAALETQKTGKTPFRKPVYPDPRKQTKETMLLKEGRKRVVHQRAPQ